MSDLEELISICLTGRVNDLPARPTPEEVEDVLGGDYLDVWDKKRRFLRRDYGILEFHFLRENGLKCRTIGLQLHRLRNNPHALSHSELRILGEISADTSWTDLAGTIEETNGSIPEADISQAGFILYHFADTGVEVFVDTVNGGLPDPDKVWAIVITFRDQ